MAKSLVFGPNLGSLGPILGRQNFFFKNLASSVTRYQGNLSSCIRSEKTNDPILKKFMDGRTDGRTERQTDDSDFIGSCSTNVKHPKIAISRVSLTMK